MTIAVVGATGTAGSRVMAQLEATTRDFTPLSRANGIDLHTGEGLVDALRGVSVVIDTSNPMPEDDDTDVVGTMSEATAHLMSACTEAGVEHLVFLSINSIDAPVFDDFPYYVAKRAQEQVLQDSALPATIIRSSQWYEFATNPSAVTFYDDRIEVQDWLIQPIAVDTVAEVLVDAAEHKPAMRLITGPDRIRLPELSRAYFEQQADPRPVHAVAPFIEELGTGVLLPPDEAERLGPTSADWLAQQGK